MQISRTHCSLRLLPQIGLSSKLFAEGSGRPAQDTGRNRNLGSKTIGRGETAYPSRVAGAVAQAVIHHAVCLKLPWHHLFSKAPHRGSDLSRQGNGPIVHFPIVEGVATMTLLDVALPFLKITKALLAHGFYKGEANALECRHGSRRHLHSRRFRYPPVLKHRHQPVATDRDVDALGQRRPHTHWPV